MSEIKVAEEGHHLIVTDEVNYSNNGVILSGVAFLSRTDGCSNWFTVDDNIVMGRVCIMYSPGLNQPRN